MSVEAAPEFVDSNVLVYLHDRSAGEKQALAKDLVDRLWRNRQGCLSIQVLQEFYVNVTQKVPKPIPPDQACTIVSALGEWRTHRPAVADVVAAIDIQQRHRLSF